MNHIVIDVSSDEKDDEKPKSTDLLVENEDYNEGDCVILDYDPTVKRIVVESCETDEVLVTGQKNEIACRDFPHPRHACAKYPFKSTLHQQYCEKCYCYVCDTRAPCPYWFNGFSTDHCHANDKEQTWQNQRKRIRTGNTVSKLAPTIAQCKRVSSPRPVLLPQNSSSSATQLGIKACSKSASLTRHTRAGYRTDQSRPQAVNSNPYLSTQRPSRGVSFSFMANDGQSIAQRSHAIHYASPVPLLSNAQQIVTGGFSTVPVSHSKEYATQFYGNTNSGNLQTNAAPSMTSNLPANQKEQQQPGRSKDKILSELEDWLLDDSTLVCPLFK